MKSLSTVFYFGDDQDFLKELVSFASSFKKDVKIENGLYKKGQLKETSLNIKPTIIFIDFTYQGLEIQELYNEILILKKTLTFKGCLFVALFADPEHLKNNSHIFSLGFQLSFIKGCETDVLFRDSFFIGFGDNISFPRYAKAKDIYKDLRIGICSTVSSMSSDCLTLETDFESIEGALSFELSFFPDLKNPSFKVRSLHNASKLYPMTTTYELELPFPDPWGEESERTILKDTIETWFDFNRSTMDLRNGFIQIINSNVSFIQGIDDSLIQPFFVELTEKIQNDSMVELWTKRPDLIFYEIDDVETGGNSFDNLAKIVKATSSMEGYYPVIVVSNCQSSGQALQKLFHYQFITSSPLKLDYKIFYSLINSFVVKKKLKGVSNESFYFSPADNRRAIDLIYNFKISSLTEHEVTFISDVELPMFSVLHFKLPVEFYATLVPAFFKLSAKGGGFHYMAIIHGIEEEEVNKLRQFVYQIIYKPIENFDFETVTSILEQFKLGYKPPEKLAQTADAQTQDEIQREESQEIIRNFRVNGKSKL